MNPPDLKYSRDHEWVRLEGLDGATVGITGFAAESLGDVVYVDLPVIGTILSQFDKMGEIESVKTVSDIFTPMAGRVLQVNEQILENPQFVNESSFELGWLVKLQLSDPSQLGNLMTVEEYEAFLKSASC